MVEEFLGEAASVVISCAEEQNCFHASIGKMGRWTLFPLCDATVMPICGQTFAEIRTAKAVAAMKRLPVNELSPSGDSP
ncbi:MAG: hypothetical protein AB1508_14235 [Pseudomonadota bacterium]